MGHNLLYCHLPRSLGSLKRSQKMIPGIFLQDSARWVNLSLGCPLPKGSSKIQQKHLSQEDERVACPTWILSGFLSWFRISPCPLTSLTLRQAKATKHQRSLSSKRIPNSALPNINPWLHLSKTASKFSSQINICRAKRAVQKYSKRAMRQNQSCRSDMVSF